MPKVRAPFKFPVGFREFRVSGLGRGCGVGLGAILVTRLCGEMALNYRRLLDAFRLFGVVRLRLSTGFTRKVDGLPFKSGEGAAGS